jgi:Lrp/AsnC family transcriptional regulator for asnA, asnC and gidA
MEPIDDLDYQIILLLGEDGRMPSAEMARRLEQPVRTIGYRLQRMQDQGTIQICPIVNPTAFGYKILADVLIETEAGKVLEVAEAAAELPQVSYVACAAGDRDVSVQVVAPTVDDLYRFITDTLHNIPGVRRTQTVLLPIKLKDVYEWQPPNPYRE